MSMFFHKKHYLDYCIKHHYIVSISIYTHSLRLYAILRHFFLCHTICHCCPSLCLIRDFITRLFRGSGIISSKKLKIHIIPPVLGYKSKKVKTQEKRKKEKKLKWLWDKDTNIGYVQIGLDNTHSSTN